VLLEHLGAARVELALLALRARRLEQVRRARLWADIGEIYVRCRGDAGEMQGRYGGDAGEIWGREI